MAPPPLPQDYGGGTGGGWNTGSSAAVTSAPPPVQDDDWGWKPQEQAQNNTSAPRYGNVEDDLWSNNDAGNDANYNEASSSTQAAQADPFDPFGQPPQIKQEPAPPQSATALANQVTSSAVPQKTLSFSFLTNNCCCFYFSLDL